MIYDKSIVICDPPERGLPLSPLHPVAFVFCAEKEVYTRSYFDAIQTGSRIDKMVQIPLTHDWRAGMFAVLDNHVYKLVQTKDSSDLDGLPITILSLERLEASYDVAAPG